MEYPVTIAIMIFTAVTSFQAFGNQDVFLKLMHNPYQVIHRKQYYRVLSHALIHNDYLHLGLNMFVFYSFGRAMEQYFTISQGKVNGSLLFLLLYIGAVVAASLPSLQKHRNNPNYNSVGASGGVSAMTMAFVVLAPVAQLELFFFLPMPAYIFAILFFVSEYILDKQGRTNIAHDAHIYGAMFGILFMILIDYHLIGRAIRQIIDFPMGM